MKYRKKPVVIEAFRLGDEWPDWWADKISTNEITTEYDGSSRGFNYALIKTLEGTMRAERGDWIIKGVKGEIYPCKPDIFEQTYEAAEGLEGFTVPWSEHVVVADPDAVVAINVQACPPPEKHLSHARGFPGFPDQK